MKGISAVLATVLIVVITVAIIGLAYGWATGLFKVTSEATETQIKSQTTYLTAAIKISAANPSTIYVRNIGQAELHNFTLFKNNKLVSSDDYIVIPDSLPEDYISEIKLLSGLFAYEGEKNIIKVSTKEGAESEILVSNISNVFDYKNIIGGGSGYTQTTYCEDGICNDDETCNSCPKDCGLCCGDGTCNYAETCLTCELDCGECIYGCMDSTASNFNPLATVEDNSCTYPPSNTFGVVARRTDNNELIYGLQIYAHSDGWPYEITNESGYAEFELSEGDYYIIVDGGDGYYYYEQLFHMIHGTATTIMIVPDLEGPEVDWIKAATTTYQAVMDGTNPYTVTGNSFAIAAYINDSARTLLAEAEYFIDATGSNGSGMPMACYGLLDTFRETFNKTIDSSSWTAGESHTFYIHGKDSLNYWGEFDTIIITKE